MLIYTAHGVSDVVTGVANKLYLTVYIYESITGTMSVPTELTPLRATYRIAIVALCFYAEDS